MNEEIKKFWEDIGYNIHNSIWNGIIYWWIDMRPNDACIAKVFDANSKYYYPAGSKFSYTEKQMLRMIKLKAFL
jgi:hypothetical protein